MTGVNRILVAAATSVLLLLLASCGNEAGPGAGGGDVLEERTFLSTEVTGRDLVAGTRVTLRFDEDTVGAQAGCNQLSGNLRIDGDVLQVDQVGGTEMGCDPERHAQDQWLSEFLTSRPTFSLDGDTLTLTAGAVTITLLDRKVAEPDLPLIGTRWTLDTIIDGDAASSVPQGVEVWVQLHASKIAGHDGCSEFGGDIEIDEGRSTITFGVRMGGGDCAEAARRVADAVAAVTTGEVAYTIDANRLTLTAADGRGASFTAPA